MAESDPGRARSAITKEMLQGSQKAILSIGTEFPHFETIGALSGVIVHRLVDFPPPEAKTNREKKKLARKARKEEKRPMRANDVDLLRRTVNALPREELPEEMDLDELNAALRRMHERMQDAERTRSNKRIVSGLGGAALVAVLSVVGAVKVVYDNSVENALNAEKSIVLKTEPSSPSYTGWTIQAAPAEKRYAVAGEGVVVGEQESIKLKDAEGKTIDTGFEMQPYTTVRGQNGMKVFNPLKAPYYGFDDLGPLGRLTQLPIIDIFTRKSDEAADKQELVVLNTSAIAVLRGQQGQIAVVSIADTTPEDETDTVYTVTPLQEAA